MFMDAAERNSKTKEGIDNKMFENATAGTEKSHFIESLPHSYEILSSDLQHPHTSRLHHWACNISAGAWGRDRLFMEHASHPV